MIQVQLKLRPTKVQERQMARWLWRLTGVYNWALRKIDLDSKDGIYRSELDLQALLVGHSTRLGIPLSVIRSTLGTAYSAWQRRFGRLSGRPRMKGRRNRLNTLRFPDGTKIKWEGHRRVRLPGLGLVRFHRQEIPEGRVSSGRVLKRASGWYLCLVVRAEPREIPVVADGVVGIDPGFMSLLTLSTGEKIEHPRELQRTADRLARAQRGHRGRLTARLLERQRNQRKDRNHKLSRRLVAENALIAWSKDSHQKIARRFGKSVASAAHGQLRQMLAYKSRSGGRQFVEVSNRYSTMTCSACGARSGPAGYAGLSVRQWTCGCGAMHDRDCNAAVNTLLAGLGMSLDRGREAATGIAI